VRRRGCVFFLLLTVVLVGSPSRADDALRRKLGQMLVIGFVGLTAPDSLLADLTVRNLGGVIVSTGNGNLNKPLQIQQLISQVRSAAQTPPFVSTDQEGGMVARLNASDGFASTYSAYTLGTVFSSLDSTAKQAALMASWLQQCGMNVNFAPVADVDVNPSSPAIGYYGRSFSPNAMTVAAHDQVFVNAFHAQGIITTLKHFPGHGSAGTDSHFTLPDITNTWADSELTPYRELLKTNSVDIVMVGHLFNAKIDSVYPSSLSRNTVQGLLRNTLGYTGVVITDDLFNMAAITDNFGFFDAAEHAINAGVDILLYVGNTYNGASLCRQLVDTLEAMVQRGTISMARINEAYSRIIQLKNRYQISDTGRLASIAGIPESYRVTNYPNPFNPSTTVRFSVPVSGMVTLKVYDLLGHELETLFSGNLAAGQYEAHWSGSGRSSGVYFCRLQQGSAVVTTKLVLLK
jgi:beta-N-acetylhexosaminidase